MDFLTYAQRLDYILRLIQKSALHSPKELTEKFECSERTIRKMIRLLREKGNDIRYSRSKGKYYLMK